MGLTGSTTDPVQESSTGCPVQESSTGCPVLRDASKNDGQNGEKINPQNWMPDIKQQPSPGQPFSLPTQRVVSSIPMARPKEGEAKNWVYPSEQQFWNAMIRKGWRWQSQDVTPEIMKSIVQIHNKSNEIAWSEILKWEIFDNHDPKSIKLARFHGDANKLSPRARFRCILGYVAPFDRHDWIIDREGKEVRYILDYYDIEDENRLKEGNFIFIDVRPAFDNLWAVKVRTKAFLLRKLSSYMPEKCLKYFLPQKSAPRLESENDKKS